MATELEVKLAAMTAAFLAKLTDRLRELQEAASPLDDTAADADTIAAALA